MANDDEYVGSVCVVPGDNEESVDVYMFKDRGAEQVLGVFSLSHEAALALAEQLTTMADFVKKPEMDLPPFPKGKAN